MNVMKKLILSVVTLLLLAAGVNAEVTEVMLNSSITKPQPMTGLVLWPDQARDLYSTHGGSIRLEFAYCLPCKVVTGCGDDGTIQYDWTWFENILDDVASRGHQLIARFRYEYPNSKDVDGKTAGMTAVPQYIKDRSDYNETYNKVKGDGPTWYADWSNAELKRFTKQFYTDFAARYASDPRLAFLEVGFGHWSEYHIYATTPSGLTLIPSGSTSATTPIYDLTGRPVRHPLPGQILILPGQKIRYSSGLSSHG